MVARRSARRGPARRPLATDESGVSAIEFALIAPVLIVMFMGLCDLCSAVMTQLHVDRATAGTGDVVATYSAMQTSDMVNMFTAASQFMQPYSATPLSVRITNVYAAQNGNAQVYWSCVSQNSTIPILAANSVVSTTLTGAPIAFLVTTNQSTSYNSSFIMVDVSYTFSSPTNKIISGTHVMTSSAYLQPRQGLYVGFPWSGVGAYPTAPNSTTTSSSTTLTNGATCNYRH
jgi:Flp pilus assembly protein TadG